MALRRFHFERNEDESGVSGTGIVAEGVLFGEHFYVVHWLTPHRSITTYLSLAEMEAVHGHGGRTKIIWDDEPIGPEEISEKNDEEQELD